MDSLICDTVPTTIQCSPTNTDFSSAVSVLSNGTARITYRQRKDDSGKKDKYRGRSFCSGSVRKVPKYARKRPIGRSFCSGQVKEGPKSATKLSTGQSSVHKNTICVGRLVVCDIVRQGSLVDEDTDADDETVATCEENNTATYADMTEKLISWLLVSTAFASAAGLLSRSHSA